MAKLRATRPAATCLPALRHPLRPNDPLNPPLDDLESLERIGLRSGRAVIPPLGLRLGTAGDFSIFIIIISFPDLSFWSHWF